MARKKRKETKPNWSFEDFKWCIDNDWQVYPVPVNRGTHFKIGIRRGGISTNGKDFHRDENGVLLTSKERLGEMLFKDIKSLTEYLPNVYRQLREKYEK